MSRECASVHIFMITEYKFYTDHIKCNNFVRTKHTMLLYSYFSMDTGGMSTTKLHGII